jgi:hypothetical protein
MQRRLGAGMVGAALLAVGASGCSSAGDRPGPATGGDTASKVKAPPKLTGMVAPSGQITLAGPDGHPIRSPHAGWYTVSVQDRSPAAQFHLVGPGADEATGVSFRGAVIWGIHLTRGTYRYTNDRHHGATTRAFAVR